MTAEKERLKLIVPLVKKYQCSVVALTMNEQGIPEDSKERFKIAEELIKEISGQRIPLENIYVDPLVLPISTNI